MKYKTLYHNTITYKLRNKMIKVIKNSKYHILLCLLMISSITYGQTPGSRYTGTYKKSGPIVYKYQNNIVIEGLEFSSANERAITLWGCKDVIIKNCKFINVDKNVAVFSEKGSNILVTDCFFENVYGAFFAESGSGNIKFEYNDVKNVLGPLRGGPKQTSAVQYRRITGVGNSISNNVIENIEGKSAPDDNINVFNSSGTPGSPIRVANNWIRGGGPSLSGGGILLGDWGGSYQIAENNIVVNPGQYGMGIAGGNNMTLRNNKIYSKKRPVTNVGLSICNWTVTKTTGPSYNITVENNEVNWTHRDGYLNMWYINKNMDMLKGKETNKYNSNLDESILPKVILNRAKNPGDNTPPVTPPVTDDSSLITEVYIDSFKRIAIKYLVSSIPIPIAHAEGYSSTGKLLIAMTLPRYNQAFPISVPNGDYYIKITYPELGKSETTKITIK